MIIVMPAKAQAMGGRAAQCVSREREINTLAVENEKRHN